MHTPDHSLASAADAGSPLSRAVAALERLAAVRPVESLKHADLARESGLSWQTVRSLLGPRTRFAEWLARPALATTPADTRSRILAAAARVFADKSLHAATLDEVAAAAGLTKGAVYWHFAGKNDLFFALLDRRCGEMDQYLPTAASEAGADGERAGGDGRAAVSGLLSRILGRLTQDPEWPRLFVEFFGQTREPAVRERLGRRYQESYANVAAMIRAGMPTGNPPAGDPELLALFWTSLVDGLVLAWLANPELIRPEEKIVQIIDLLWNGLGQRAADAAQVQSTAGDPGKEPS